MKTKYLDLRIGDCEEGMKEFPDNHFDLAIVDPPYRDKNQPTKEMRAKIGGAMRNFGGKPSQSYFDQVIRVSKNQIIWGANNFISNLTDTNCFLFWYKNNPMPNYSDGELAWTSFGSVARCIPIPFFGSHTYDNYRIHPTQKPVKLYKWLLKNYAESGQKILDTHLGSMSIAIACHDYKCHLTGFEIDEDYFKAGTQRVQNHVNQLQLF